MVERLLLARFAPASMVVDDAGEHRLHPRPDGRVPGAHRGQPRHNLLEMARHGLARPLAAALRQAATESREVVREDIRVKTNGNFTHVNLDGDPRSTSRSRIRGLLLVTICPTRPRAAVTPRAGKEDDDRPGQPQRDVEHELRFVKESLQTTIEELETSNEELKSTNEELQSTNEELQSRPTRRWRPRRRRCNRSTRS